MFAIFYQSSLITIKCYTLKVPTVQVLYSVQCLYPYGHCTNAQDQYDMKSIATLPPFGPIEGQKWFEQISSQ
jgi:hypothetical protein